MICIDWFKNDENIKKIGLLFLLAYAFLCFADSSLAKSLIIVPCIIGLYLMVRQSFFPKALFYFLLAIIIVQTMGWFSMWLDHEPWNTKLPKFDFLVKYFPYLLLMVFIAGNEKRVLIVWSAALAGFFWLILFSPNTIAYWQQALSGGRPAFGLRNVQDLALFFGVMFFALVCFRQRLLQGKYLWLKTVLFAVCLLINLFGVVFTQTRGIWVASFVVLMFLLVSTLFKNKEGLSKKNIIYVGVLLFLAQGALHISGQDKVFLKRINTEQETIEKIVTLQWDEVPLTSVGIRFHLWNNALTYIKQRPLLGWHSPLASKKIIEQDTEVRAIKVFTHHHNIYVEILVIAGVCGLLLFLCFIGYIMKHAYNARKKNLIAADIYQFNLCFWILFGVANFFEPYLIFNNGRIIVILMLLGVTSLIPSLYANVKRAE